VPGLSLPVANKRCVEAGHAPIVRCSGAAAADLPARLRRTGLDSCTLAQKKRSDVFVLGCEREPAAGDEIENFRIAGYFHDHGAEAGAGQGVDPGAQRVGRIGHTQQKKLRRIDSQFRKAGWRERAMLEHGEILNDPEHALGAAHTL
jgi:hypothetical protein